MKTGNDPILITGIGTALPFYFHSQKNISEYFSLNLNLSAAEKRKLKVIYNLSGIENRYTVINSLKKLLTLFNSQYLDQLCLSTKERMEIYQQEALPLALTAIKNCIDNMNDQNKVSEREYDYSDISHLITVSCTGMYAPGLDIDIIQALKLSSNIHRTCINFMGCYAVFNALKSAESICKANPKAKVLIVSVELCSLHFQKVETLDHLISSALFSDGAGALIVQSEHSIHQKSFTQNPLKFFELKDFYCELLSQGCKEMAWNIGDTGFDIILSTYISDLIKYGIKDFLKNLLERNQNIVQSELYYAIHPGGKKILESCEIALNLTASHLKESYDTLKNYGNMSSATIIFVLKKLWDSISNDHHNKNVLSCAFGPGLTIESMLLKTGYRNRDCSELC